MDELSSNGDMDAPLRASGWVIGFRGGSLYLSVHLAAVESRLNIIMGSHGRQSAGRRVVRWSVAPRWRVQEQEDVERCVPRNVGRLRRLTHGMGEARRRWALLTCILARLAYQGAAGEFNPASPQSWMVVATGHRRRLEWAMQGRLVLLLGKL